MSDLEKVSVRVESARLGDDLLREPFFPEALSKLETDDHASKGRSRAVWQVVCIDMKSQDRPEDKKPYAGITYSGGGGSAPEEAVVIEGASSHAAGIRAEKQYLARRFGEEGADWRLQGQSLLVGDAQVIDKLTVETASGETETFYFEISDFFRIGD